MKSLFKKILPSSLLRAGQKMGFYKTYTPLPGKVVIGDLNRTKPLSNNFGYERGGPIDRYYIESFLKQNCNIIQGRVLEIGDNEYTMRFGSSVEVSDIMHIDATNPKATFVGDLSNAPHLPDDCFDCIILTQTLQFIYDLKGAVATCYRVLKPGGVLLLTVPGISHIDQGEWKDIWLWSFTEASIRKLLQEVYVPEDVQVDTFGNVLVAAAFLYGFGMPELKKHQLDEVDPHYQVIITAKATKPL
jgi:SAM-dependent methyltransferase